MGKRGSPQRGRSDVFQPEKPVRAQTVLPPGDPVRKQYEELVAALGVSGAEILREGIKKLHGERFGSQTLQEAS